jgi:hypothetical protein
VNEQREWGWLINDQLAPDPRIHPTSYMWWRRGATDEHFLGIEGVSEENQQLLEVVRGLSRLGSFTNEELCLTVARIYFGEGRWVPTGEPATPTWWVTPGIVPCGAPGCCPLSATGLRPPATTAE